MKKATTTVGFLFYSRLLFFCLFFFFFFFSFFEFSFLRGVGLFSPRKQGGGGNREREGGVRIGGGTPNCKGLESVEQEKEESGEKNKPEMSLSLCMDGWRSR